MRQMDVTYVKELNYVWIRIPVITLRVIRGTIHVERRALVEKHSGRVFVIFRY